ncbi:hypothetical protein B9T07_23005 [Limnospira fusiformis CCALA 023]
MKFCCENFFSGGGVAFAGGSCYHLDNGSGDFFEIIKHISIIKLYLNILSLVPGCCQPSAQGGRTKFFF